MTNYGPPGPPQGPPPGYGPPGGPPPGAPQGPPRPPMTAQQRLAIMYYLGAGLGALNFIWGFLDWISVGNGVGGDNGSAGYVTTGTAAIALGLFAGLLALAEVLEKRPPSLLPSAAAITCLLLTFGIMVSLPDGVSVEVGLILALISSIAQAGVLVFAWLSASGRIAQRPSPPGGSSPPTVRPAARRRGTDRRPEVAMARRRPVTEARRSSRNSRRVGTETAAPAASLERCRAYGTSRARGAASCRPPRAARCISRRRGRAPALPSSAR